VTRTANTHAGYQPGTASARLPVR